MEKWNSLLLVGMGLFRKAGWWVLRKWNTEWPQDPAIHLVAHNEKTWEPGSGQVSVQPCAQQQDSQELKVGAPWVSTGGWMEKQNVVRICTNGTVFCLGEEGTNQHGRTLRTAGKRSATKEQILDHAAYMRCLVIKLRDGKLIQSPGECREWVTGIYL